MGLQGIAFWQASVVAVFSVVLWDSISLVSTAPQQLPCVPVELPAYISEFAGTEDITIDADSGIAFISSCDFHTLLLSGKAEQGGIFMYDLANSKAGPQERLHRLQPVGLPRDLSFKCPHGMGIWPPSSAAHPELGSKKYLFVIVHDPVQGKSIVKFEYNYETPEESEKHKLFFVEAFRNSKYLISPNDVIPISPRKFYFTNDHPTTNTLWQLFQDLLPQLFGNANVVLFDGVEPVASSEDNSKDTNRQDQWKVVIDGLQYANGINLSPDNKYLYVTETTGKRVSVYKRKDISGDEDHADVSLVQHIFVDSGADNIEVDDQGVLWVGTQVSSLASLYYLISPKGNSAPSQVLKITLKEKEDNLFVLDPQVEQVFYDQDGRQISASSVGAYYKGASNNLSTQTGHLLIGSMAGHHFLHCFL